VTVNLAYVRAHAISHKEDSTPCELAPDLLLALCDEIDELRRFKQARVLDAASS
jgi:hypothetical protein